MSQEDILRQWVRDNLTLDDECREGYTTYQLKHQFYIDSRNYVTDEDMYYAMIEEGYERRSGLWFVLLIS